MLNTGKDNNMEKHRIFNLLVTRMGFDYSSKAQDLKNKYYPI